LTAKNDTKTTKQKIFDAAVTLFARKGFDTVGTREIAKQAGANIAMINYYFGGKTGILIAIINTAYKNHRDAMDNIKDSATPEQRIRTVIENFVDFFRANTELCLVAFDPQPYDIPEIEELKTLWRKGNIERMIRIFEELGLNPEDNVHVSIFNGLLGNIILTHFRSCYVWEQSAEKSPCPLDDMFYQRFTDTLTSFYMHGIRGVVAEYKNPFTKQTTTTHKSS
jgi:AcrR family transcriptional regulator